MPLYFIDRARQFPLYIVISKDKTEDTTLDNGTDFFMLYNSEKRRFEVLPGGKSFDGLQ